MPKKRNFLGHVVFFVKWYYTVMDIISHGLYGGIAFGRKSKMTFWIAFFFGVAPDLFSFGIFFMQRLFTTGFDMSHSGPPDIATIPAYVSSMYNITHSLVVFLLVFGLVWIVTKRPQHLMLGWPLHILVDIPTHSNKFFPTPFLWPLSDFHVNGISWGHWFIFFPNVALLIVLYSWFYLTKKSPKEKPRNTCPF